MHPDEFHRQIDQPRLVAALADAERETVGKIYIYVSHHTIADPMAAAQKRFAHLGFSRIHEHRASVLIYIVPKIHKFAIVGDTAIHQQYGDAGWQRLADNLSRDLKAGDTTAALLNAIASLKKVLVEHFPR